MPDACDDLLAPLDLVLGPLPAGHEAKVAAVPSLPPDAELLRHVRHENHRRADVATGDSLVAPEGNAAGELHAKEDRSSQHAGVADGSLHRSSRTRQIDIVVVYEGQIRR